MTLTDVGGSGHVVGAQVRISGCTRLTLCATTKRHHDDGVANLQGSDVTHVLSEFSYDATNLVTHYNALVHVTYKNNSNYALLHVLLKIRVIRES